MFTQDEYHLAWFYYLIGVSCCGFCWWVITAKIKWLEVRVFLRALLFTLLLMPWFTQGTTGYLSPAIVAMFIEGLFDAKGSFSRAGMPLLVSMIITTMCVLVFFGVRHFLMSKRSKS